MPFQIIRNDITKVKADAIVNTANPDVTIGGGVDFAIYSAAGKDRLLAERKNIGVLMPGDVAITPAFDLDARYIIHASGPWWNGGNKGEAELLKACYDKSLKLAAEYDCKSIAFPLLATGTYKFPQRLAMEIAVEAFTGFLEEHDMEIILVVFGQQSVKISGELGEEVKSYIDDDYVTETLEEEYVCDRTSQVASDYREVQDEESLDEVISDEAVTEDKDVLPTSGSTPDRLPMAGSLPGNNVFASHSAFASSASLDDMLKSIYKESFEKHLQKLINKKGLKNSEVYAAANISKQYFSRIMKGTVNPSKKKVLALAVGLRLNLDETIDFLRIAGYALSPISQTDAVVRYFIERHDYNVIKIDIVLFDYGLDPLSKD
ncbi:macro domain-containing protein [Oribacterium sp. P6A1]|uniref:macro domain-containing protein n=1 Tax=Oribacterium sp. P6A1 TaxID=1410612 RepID=UPI00056AFDDB|nr:macro domain-containing protein [Oribacterium sp. P6A1]